MAAELGDIESLRILVAAGVDPSTRDYIGLAPIHTAAIQRRVLFLNELLQLGVDPDAKDRHGNRPMHHAAMEAGIACMALLLAHGAHANEPNFDGSTPLHHAARGSSSGAVYILLLHGAIIDVMNNAGETPASILESTRESLFELDRERVEWQLAEIEATLFLLSDWMKLGPGRTGTPGDFPGSKS
ncbi:MAG: ankyrin repeat domain-containing protein [Fimbriimonadales bacterium]|nr:ankyrin repeat domain-containing protein [Fimbriimonadales bacterium]